MAVVEVVTAEQSQQELIDRARGALSGSAWVVGECASKFCEQGGTIEQFADGLECSKATVGHQKRVWERFASNKLDAENVRGAADSHLYNMLGAKLSWTHFHVAAPWDDARKWLSNAGEYGWGVARMVEERERSTAPADQVDGAIEKPAENHVRTAETPTKQADDQVDCTDRAPAPPTTSKRTAERKEQFEPAPEVAAPVDHAELLTNRFRAVVDAMASFLEVAAGGELETAREMLAAQFPGLFEVRRPKPARFKPPTVDEVEAFCNSKGIKHFDANRFCNHYGMKGWVVGKSPMKDWKRAVLNSLEWCTSSKKKPPGAVAVPAGKYDFIDEACR